MKMFTKIGQSFIKIPRQMSRLTKMDRPKKEREEKRKKLRHARVDLGSIKSPGFTNLSLIGKNDDYWRRCRYCIFGHVVLMGGVVKVFHSNFPIFGLINLFLV